MKYRIAQHIDNNKIFIVNSSEIKGRLDAHFNKPKYTNLWKLLSNIPYKLTTLRENSISIFSGITPKSGGDAYVLNDGIPFVRSGDFSEINEIDFSKLLQIRKEIHEKVMRNSQLRVGDVLIAIVGATIGKIGVYNYDAEANINQAICAVRLNGQLNPYFVQAFFQTNIGQEVLNRIKRPVARANINLEEVGALPIPLLDPEKQKEVVELMDCSRQYKKKKLKEFQQLINGVDDLLLNKLSIISKSKKKVNNKVFLIKRSTLDGRIDPLFYYADIQKYTKCTYSERLANLAFSFTNGFAVGRQDQVEAENGILQIRPTNIDNNGRLKYDKNVYVPEMLDIPFVESGVVLFNNTNSQEWVGKTTYFANEENMRVYTSNHITAIDVDRSKILPEYLCAILNMYQRHKVFYSICTNWNNQSGIGLDLLKSLHIPLFTNDRKESLRRQQEIVDRINSIYQEADECISSANRIMEEAKAKVESMIIG